jgi:hypothetical protein
MRLRVSLTLEVTEEDVKCYDDLTNAVVEVLYNELEKDSAENVVDNLLMEWEEEEEEDGF